MFKLIFHFSFDIINAKLNWSSRGVYSHVSQNIESKEPEKYWPGPSDQPIRVNFNNFIFALQTT